MMKEEHFEMQKVSHCLNLDNRKNLSLTGVSEVDSFDDKSITVYTPLGELLIKGENLNVKKLNLEIGELEVTGIIFSLSYTNKKIGSGNNIFSKIFK